MFERLKRRLTRRKKGGFTLVEVIVSSALLGILLLGIMLFITPVLRAMRGEETNGRASIVAASMEHYITRSVRSSPYVKIYSKVKPEDVTGTGKVLSEATFSKDLEEMFEFAKNNSASYEVKCLSICEVEDERTHTKKMVLCQEFFITDSMKVNPAYQLAVFDDCFYEGLYPDVSVQQAEMDLHYTETVESGEPAAPGETKKTHYPGIEISIDMYEKPDKSAMDLVYSGYGITELYMVANKTDFTGKIYDDAVVNPGDDDAKNIYIYYISRKIPTVTP